MAIHPWGVSLPEMNAGVIETGSTSATWVSASASWAGLMAATLATMGAAGAQMAASLESISGIRSMVQAAATPPFLSWLAAMAGIAFKQAAVTAVVAESYGMTRSAMIPSMVSITNRIEEAAAEASNFFGQNTPLIAALNVQYAEYTVQNATLGNTYGDVITAATMPVPIPPAPPLSDAATTAAQAGDALGQAGQTLSTAAGGQLTQGASKAAAAVGNGGTSDMMSSMGPLLQAPLQAAQSAGQSLSSAPQSLGQLLNAPSQLFGSFSGLGDLLGGGSTAGSFAPTSLSGGGGLPLSGAHGAGAALGGGGGLGAGGLGGLAPKMGEGSVGSRNTVLSGISTPVVQERANTAGPVARGGMPMGHPAGAGSSGSRDRRDTSTLITVHTPRETMPLRRAATDSERELFS